MREDGERAVLCTETEIAEGEARVFALGGGPLREVILVREGGTLRAYRNECPHQPLPLNIDRLRTAGREMLCDHHPARFRFADGYCTEGPCAGASLVALPLELRDGLVRIPSGA